MWNLKGITFRQLGGLYKPPGLQEKVEAATDPLEAQTLLNPLLDQIPFLLNNETKFKQAGVFEKSVCRIYTSQAVPVYKHGFKTWSNLFSRCDKELLFNAPENKLQLPPGTFRIYRGADTARGFSWTLSRSIAEFYSKHCHMSLFQKKKKEQIYNLDVNNTDVAFCLEREEEVVLHPSAVARAAR